MALEDVPPDAPGVSWAVWHEQQIERIFVEAREKRQRNSSRDDAPVSTQPMEPRRPLASTNPDDDRLFDLSAFYKE
jgi:hypothetical protein